MAEFAIRPGDGKSYITFAYQPPKALRAKLAEQCEWLSYQKAWGCPAAKLKEVRRVITAEGWREVDQVTPEKAPLTVATIPGDDGDVILQFNRQPDNDLLVALKRLAATTNEDDRREFLVLESKMKAVRALLRQHEVGKAKARKRQAAAPSAPTSHEAKIRVHRDRLTLKFEGPVPPIDKISEMRGALATVGVKVTELVGAPGVTLDEE